MPEFFATKFGTDLDHPAVRAVAAGEQAAIRFADVAITCTEQMREAFSAAAPTRTRSASCTTAPRRTSSTPTVIRRALATTAASRSSATARSRSATGSTPRSRAVAALADEIPELKSARSTEKGSQLRELRELANQLDVRDRVEFNGNWIPLEELVEAIAAADAGVVAMKRDVPRPRPLQQDVRPGRDAAAGDHVAHALGRGVLLRRRVPVLRPRKITRTSRARSGGCMPTPRSERSS